METKQNNSIVKVLLVTIGDGSYGGVASFMYSYYSHMNHEKVHCDFLYCGENSMGSKEDSPALTGSKITTLHIMKSQNNGFREYSQLVKELKAFLNENCYDIVHVNTSNAMVSACVAYALNDKAVLIAHSHNTKAVLTNQGKIKEILKIIMKVPARKYILKKADYYFACSKTAGENLFGISVLRSDKFKIINNAIELSSYVYDPEIRKKYRKTDKTVIGHVGRLTGQKNPFFLIDVFSEIHKLNSSTELWMIGEGELLEGVQDRIKALGLESNITLWGRRNDVACLMQAMDIFILPSLYEGLSIVTVEAQAAGLPVYVSDSISEEHRVTNLVNFLPLASGASAWGRKITDDIRRMPVRRNMLTEMAGAGYEIETASKWLEEFYLLAAK